MPSPLITTTIQAAILSAISNILAQLMTAYVFNFFLFPPSIPHRLNPTALTNRRTATTTTKPHHPIHIIESTETPLPNANPALHPFHDPKLPTKLLMAEISRTTFSGSTRVLHDGGGRS